VRFETLNNVDDSVLLVSVTVPVPTDARVDVDPEKAARLTPKITPATTTAGTMITTTRSQNAPDRFSPFAGSVRASARGIRWWWTFAPHSRPGSTAVGTRSMTTGISGVVALDGWCSRLLPMRHWYVTARVAASVCERLLVFHT
jgi:hypothetical protein